MLFGVLLLAALAPISAFSALSRWRGSVIPPLAASQGPTPDSDDDTVFVSELQLREAWTRSGRSQESFSELAALELLDDDEEGDEEEGKEGMVDATSERGRSLVAQLRVSAAEKTPTTSAPPAPRPAGKSVGIDLGTTFSSVAAVEGGLPVIIPVDGSRLVPSVVAFLGEDRLLVGEAARRQRVLNALNTFSSVKRIIGSSVREVRERGEKLSLLKVDPSSRETCLLRTPALKNRLLQPEEVSAEVLRHLLQQASRHLNEKVERAVITVPAYFSPAQCRATERAGKLAGLEKVKLLREPEAAALAYGLSQKRPQVVLVFDLGGGTLDVSVLDVGGGLVEVKATSGDPHLGS